MPQVDKEITHHSECWREHHACCVAEVERLQMELAQAMAREAALIEFLSRITWLPDGEDAYPTYCDGQDYRCMFCGRPKYEIKSGEHAKDCGWVEARALIRNTSPAATTLLERLEKAEAEVERLRGELEQARQNFADLKRLEALHRTGCGMTRLAAVMSGEGREGPMFVQIGNYTINTDFIAWIYFGEQDITLNFAVADGDAPAYIRLYGEDRNTFLAWWEKHSPRAEVEIERLQAELSQAELAAHVHSKSLDEQAATIARLRAKLGRLRDSLGAVLEEAETDCDQDIIITECRDALTSDEERQRGAQEVVCEHLLSRIFRAWDKAETPEEWWELFAAFDKERRDGATDLSQAAIAIQRQLDEAKVENERLKKELVAQQAAFRKAVDWLWGFWDGNTLIPAPSADKEALYKAWDDLLAVSTYPWKEAAALLERLEKAEAEVKWLREG